MSKEQETGNFLDEIDMSIFSGEFQSSEAMYGEKNTNGGGADDDDATQIKNQTDNDDDQGGIKDLRTQHNNDDDDDQEDGEGDDADTDGDDTTGGGDDSADTDDTSTGDDTSEEVNEGEEVLLEYLMGSSKIKDMFDGLEDDDKPKSIEDFVDHMEAVADEMSKPEYPSDEMSELHDFVENGGNLKEYFDLKYGEVNLDGLDMDRESNQKHVVTEYMKSLGYKPNRIDKAIERFEDAGILADEAEDALEELKESRESNAKTLLKQQAENNRIALENEQKFLSDVKESIENIDNVRGLAINKKEKAKLMEYMFKPTKDGKTQYQKEYTENYHKNMIESAYFTMNKDKFVKKVKDQASTDLKKDMLSKIRKSGGRKLQGRSRRQDGSRQEIYNSIFSELK